MSKHFGDFQTPPALVTAVLESLAAPGTIWPRVLEPACGCGNFITGLLNLTTPPREIQGIELQTTHFQSAQKLAGQSPSTRVIIKNDKLFALDFRRDLRWETTGSLLVVGNPPWVTNSQLGVERSANLPHKTNLKHLRGIEALTGSSNFDISEYIWIKLIRELAPEYPTIALLCKTSVARNVLQFAFDTALPVKSASVRMIDAKKWFGAAVSACLFCVELGSGIPQYEAPVYPDLHATDPECTTGIAGTSVEFCHKTLHFSLHLSCPE
ncbi:SAM-dependent methyltransferase [Kamptonema formosum]|uniref:SAM-dependent methyltransferase n=1 Tax=Kamptonema formosum TaxID=331992 RepID=UPI00034A5082|nr:SAM-dependent methyltransferase [Oscillatoria sp. PCC 10802]